MFKSILTAAIISITTLGTAKANPTPVPVKPIEIQYLAAEKLFVERESAKDVDRALFLLEAAAVQGHTKAQLKLAKINYLGIHTAKDYKKAFKWASKASANSPEAKLILAKMYLTGKACKKDIKKGVNLIMEAKNVNYEKAHSLWKTLKL